MVRFLGDAPSPAAARRATYGGGGSDFAASLTRRTALRPERARAPNAVKTATKSGDDIFCLRLQRARLTTLTSGSNSGDGGGRRRRRATVIRFVAFFLVASIFDNWRRLRSPESANFLLSGAPQSSLIC